jgi:uncharacterized protein (TIGR03437 family)
MVEGRVLQLDGTGEGAAPQSTRGFIGSELATVTYSGPQPSFPGLWQVNAVIPDGVSGELPVFAVVGAAASNGVTVQVGK